MQSRGTRNLAEGYAQTFDWPLILWEKGRYIALFCLLSLISQLTNAVHEVNFALRSWRPPIYSCYSQSFMKPEVSLLCTLEPAVGPYSVSVISIPHSHSIIFIIHVNITLPLAPRSPKRPLSFRLIFIYIYYFPSYSTRTANSTPRDLICVTYRKVIRIPSLNIQSRGRPIFGRPRLLIKYISCYYSYQNYCPLFRHLRTRQVRKRPWTKIFLFLSKLRVVLRSVQIPIQELRGPEREALLPPPASDEDEIERSLLHA
jgi:hypothetical protein